MSDVVEFVAVDNERVRLIAHHIFRFSYAGRMRRVQISVFVLRPGNHFGQLVDLFLQFRIAAQLQQIGRAFHHLVQIGIDKPMCSMIFDFFVGQKVTSRLQVFDTRLGAFKRKRDKRLSLRLQPWAPEVTCHLDLIKGNGLEGIITRNCRPAGNKPHHRKE